LTKLARFLLARLHMDSLLGKLNAREVRKALAELPNGVYDTYDEAMVRIGRQDKPRTQLAEQVLSWITLTLRPLSVEELQHALAIEPESTSLDPETIIDEEILTSVCAGLVVIDEKRRTFRLVRE
jgi:ankyrin repeat domain-containing protein 50